MHHLLELSLGAADLEVRHATFRRVAHSLTLAHIAKGLDLPVGDTRVDDHSPVLLHVFGLSERLSLVGEVVVENWNTGDELGPSCLVSIDPGTLSKRCDQPKSCSEAAWHERQRRANVHGNTLHNTFQQQKVIAT